MRRFLTALVLICFLATPAVALELSPPDVPDGGAIHMPDSNSSFGVGLWQIFQSVIREIRPDVQAAVSACFSIAGIVILMSIIQSFQSAVKYISNIAGTIAVATSLFLNANSMIQLGTKTITELSEYGKLLLPVMTTAMAAQGGITSSAAIYTGTTVILSILSSMIAKVFLPILFCFLALATANSVIGEDLLKNMRDLLKQFLGWALKIILTVFTTYISITGVVSGTTDAAALKATKVTISSFVPVVGSILSDASEAVLVSIGLAKNAAGIYGIFAILSLFLEPFLKIGFHYLLLKATSSVFAIFGPKQICDLINDFSSAMAMLLGMTGTVCTLLLITVICFMKGIG